MSTATSRGRIRLAIAGFIIALVVYGMAIGYLSVRAASTSNRLDQAEAKQAAQEAAAHQAEVTVCRRQLAQAPTTAAILASLRDLIEARVESSRQALATDPDSPLADIRRAAIAQGAVSLVALTKIDVQLRNTTPTRARCDFLAKKYGIAQSTQGRQDK